MSNEPECKCQHCNQAITFPEAMAGQTVECPHCHLETQLFKPHVSTTVTQKKNGTPIVLAIVALVFVFGIGVAVSIVSSKSRNSYVLPNVEEVKGALGWNLGDVLPSTYQTTTNDNTYGITYYFDPPADLGLEKNTLTACYLVLTEDQKIARIVIQSQENDRFNSSNFQKYLRRSMALGQFQLSKLVISGTNRCDCVRIRRLFG